MKQDRGKSKLERGKSPLKTAMGAEVGGSHNSSGSAALENPKWEWAQSLLDAFSEGILVADDAGRIFYANQQVELLFGWKREELIGETIDILLPPGVRLIHQMHRQGYMREPVRKPMGTGRVLLGRRKNGTDFHVEISLSPLETEAGTQVICLVSDVSGRVETETRLSTTVKRYESLFKAFPLPTYVWQRQGDDFVLIDYNEADPKNVSAIRKLYGSSLSAIYPEGRREIADVTRCYQEKVSFKRQYRDYRLRSTGELRDILVTFVFGEPDLVMVIVEDETDQHATFNELQRLSSAVEQTADAIFITDHNGLIEYVNPGFEVITGYSRAEALGKTPRILKSGQMPPEYYHNLWNTVLGGEVFRGQTMNRRQDGVIFVAEQTITPMKDDQGRITHLVSVLKDMTERLQLHEHETENRLARNIQNQLYPTQQPQIAGYDIAGALFSANATSGDYFDFISMQENTLGIMIADVCGHGMGPALLMAETRAYLRSITSFESDPRTVLGKLNLQLYPDLFEDSNFITAFFARLDPERHLLACANAGNWPAYIFDSQGRVVAERRTDGIPLGIFQELELRPSKPVPLAPGSIALFLTDGIPEAHDRSERMFGIRRMLGLVRRYRMAPASEIIARLRERVKLFMGPVEQEDDQTIIVCKRVG
jgi:phosphoserine phosphatase RsbU/P